MFAPEAIEEVVSYLFYQIVSFVTSFIEDSNLSSITLFDMDWVKGLVFFFQLLGGSLFVVGLLLALSEWGISAWNNESVGSLSTVGVSIAKAIFAVLLFAQLPISLYKLSVNLYSVLAPILGGDVATAPSIGTLIQAFLGDMVNRYISNIPVVGTITSVWDFLSNLGGSSGKSFILDYTLVLELIVTVYVVIKVFFGNLKRAGFILVMICTGSLHMMSLPRGYTDGFTSWCKQVIALCFTTFMQNVLFTLGIVLISGGAEGLYLALGVLLTAAEVPKLAQMFGFDTSSRGNAAGIMHTASSAFMLIRAIK